MDKFIKFLTRNMLCITIIASFCILFIAVRVYYEVKSDDVTHKLQVYTTFIYWVDFDRNKVELAYQHTYRRVTAPNGVPLIDRPDMIIENVINVKHEGEWNASQTVIRYYDDPKHKLRNKDHWYKKTNIWGAENELPDPYNRSKEPLEFADLFGWTWHKDDGWRWIR